MVEFKSGVPDERAARLVHREVDVLPSPGPIAVTQGSGCGALDLGLSPWRSVFSDALQGKCRMSHVEVLGSTPDTLEGRPSAGWLRCVNCGRDVCAVLGGEAVRLDQATLTCPQGAPPAVRVSASIVRCGRCDGRVLFEHA